MPTRFSSLGITGTATIATLVATAVTLTTVTITTGTFTTANITTANTTTENVQTLSGATIKALQANGIVQARTISGAAVTTGVGLTNSIFCKKATGAIGYRTISATGTIVAGSCT